MISELPALPHDRQVPEQGLAQNLFWLRETNIKDPELETEETKASVVLAGLLMAAQGPSHCVGSTSWALGAALPHLLPFSFLFVYHVTYPWDLFITFPYRVVLCI